MTETLPSWEEIVRRVTIASSPPRLNGAAIQWRQAHAKTKDAYEAVSRLSRQTTGSWTGTGADAFRTHLGALATSLRSNMEQYERFARSLEACHGQLLAAIRSIPVPSWLYEEVRTQQSAFNGSMPPELEPDWFWTTWIGSNMNTVEQAWRGWYEGEQAKAQRIYQELCRAYSEEVASLRAAPVPVPGVNAADRRTGSAGGATAPPKSPTAPTMPTTPASTAPSAAPPTSASAPTTAPPTDLPTTLPAPDYPSSGSGLDPYRPSSFDPYAPSKVAGLDGGFGGGGGGFGGGGGGGGPDLGLAGAGAALGPLAMGPAVSPPPGVLAGAGAGAAGGGLAGAGMGMMPPPMMGGAGAGGADSGKSRGGNLFEDDEDFFAGRQASSGVIDV